MNPAGFILKSYRHWLGKDLISPEASPLDQEKALFDAPFVVAASNNDPDPLLIYGNQKALDLWELPWERFTRMPARATAEAREQASRQAILD